MGPFTTPAPLPEFRVRLCAPDIAQWAAGNIGIAGITTLDSQRPGPHVALLSLMHGNELAGAIGRPPLVVADKGHVNGRRLIDYPRFSSPETPCSACLVEAGQHWEQTTVDTVLASVAGLLRHLDVVAPDAPLPPAPPPVAPRVATVTTAVTAMTSSFAFVQTFRGGDIIARRNTLIAVDGDTEIRTPHDDCLLVMPSLRPSRGHTAVRLGRFE
jgi:hypothetical protein